MRHSAPWDPEHYPKTRDQQALEDLADELERERRELDLLREELARTKAELTRLLRHQEESKQ